MSVYVAIDHRDESIIRHLDSIPDKEELCVLRRQIATIATKTLADGLVISASDFVWAHENLSHTSLVLGLPDVSQWEPTKTEILRSINQLSIRPRIAKLGFAVDSHDNEPAKVLVHIRHTIEMGGQSLNWILEPYFEDSFSRNKRREFLFQASELKQLVAFKLDVNDPNQFAAIYTGACGRPWFARSDGVNFSEFCERFMIAVRAGCVGAIAGAALWAETVSALVKEGVSESIETNIADKVGKVKEILRSNRKVSEQAS